jgi:SH3-like domain-containing protein
MKKTLGLTGMACVFATALWAEGERASKAPPPRPADLLQPVSMAPAVAAAQTAPKANPQREMAGPPMPMQDANRGAVTNLPLPRFVSLKTNEGNARRGPGLTHRIDWVFTRAGMPLKVTAEYENWRRIEDAEGAGGWVHYSMLSGSRTVLVTVNMVNVLNAADDAALVNFQAEAGVVGRVQECTADWCRIGVEGERGWVRKSALWGVDAGELVE